MGRNDRIPEDRWFIVADTGDAIFELARENGLTVREFRAAMNFALEKANAAAIIGSVPERNLNHAL